MNRGSGPGPGQTPPAGLSNGAHEPQGILSVAIVLYRSDPALLARTLRSLALALQRARLHEQSRVVLIDHSPDADEPGAARLAELAREWLGAEVEVVADAANPGFGAGHNRLLGVQSQYHLILNPDVELAPDALTESIGFLNAHPECGLLAPAAYDDDGQQQFLCKRYPTVLDLLLRGFAPGALRHLFRKRLAHYEMRDAIGAAVHWDPPIVSGSFMLFRTEVLRATGGFNERFFLYFEDFDLSLRTRRWARIAYVPQVRIVHHGGHAARKGWRHVWLFARSAVTFFSEHRWAWI